MKNYNYRFLLLSIFFILISPHYSSADNRFRINPYLWATQSSGSMTTDGVPSDTDLDIGDAFSKGNGAINVDLEIRTGSINLLSQFVYSPLEDTSPEVIGPIYDAGELSYEQIYLTEMLGLSVYDNGREYFDITAGGRMTNISNDLKLRGGPEDRRRYEDGDTWVDPLVGFNTSFLFDDKTSFTLIADIGGFDVSSSLTWQAHAFMDFHLHKAVSLAVGYKALSVDYEQDNYQYEMLAHGPTIGLDLRF